MSEIPGNNTPAHFDLASARRISDVVHAVESQLRLGKSAVGEGFEMTAAKLLTEAPAKGGFYNAEEVLWDGTAWITFDDNRQWDGTELPRLYDINGTLDLPDDSIVYPFIFHSDQNEEFGFTQWTFFTGIDRLVAISADDDAAGFLEDKLKVTTLHNDTPPSPITGNKFLETYVDPAGPNNTEVLNLDGDINNLDAAGTLDGSELVMVKKGSSANAHKKTTTQEIGDLQAGQNLWSKIIADGPTDTTANALLDELTVAGGTGITTAIAGDVLTITATGSAVDEKVKVSSDDLIAEYLEDKFLFPNELGDDPSAGVAGGPDNQALTMLIDTTASPGSGELIVVDFDINRLDTIVSIASPVASDFIMFAQTPNGGTHIKIAFEDLSTEGIEFHNTPNKFRLDFNGLGTGTFDPINDFLAFYDVTATAVHRKKSLDGMLKTIAGYTAGNDQVLTHTSGAVMTWVDTTDCP